MVIWVLRLIGPNTGMDRLTEYCREEFGKFRIFLTKKSAENREFSVVYGSCYDCIFRLHLYVYSLFHTDNTTITVSYEDTTHIRDIDDRNRVYIPVMTENVIISCDADMALWTYNPTDISQQTDIPNPLMIDLFTLQYGIDYFCTDVNINNKRVLVNIVILYAYGELYSD